jgi:two-component system, chemotaxis family, protein-glutamate methylesterase/glutaminase
MATHDIIVIGASAGGVEAISTVVAELPRDLRGAVLVVLHLARGRSVMPEILTRVARMPAVHPSDGERLQFGRIYVAPPDHHLVVEGDTVRTTHGPTENGVRPAVDTLFRSAARFYGPRVIGVVLTGSLDDGTAGLAAIKEAGGIAVVQDPEEAFAPSMPRSAMHHVDVDHVLPLREIGPLLVSLTHENAGSAGAPRGPHLRAMEPDRGEVRIAHVPGDRPGNLAVFTCPECNGNLWESEDAGILRFRCRVGHVYTADSMLAAHTDGVDRALWFALKALEERVALTRKLAERARGRQHMWVARAFDERALAAEEHAAAVKGVLSSRTAGHVVPDHTFDDAGPEPAAVLEEEE